MLEHVPDPKVTLGKIHTFMKPESTLKLILPKERHGKSDLAPDPHMHLFSWNFRNINNLLSLCGYEVTENRELYHWGFQKLMPIKKSDWG